MTKCKSGEPAACKLRRTFFFNHGYPNIFFNNLLLRFLYESKEQNLTATAEKEVQRLFLRVPYLVQASKRFFKNVHQLVEHELDIVIQPIYTTCKVGQYCTFS